MSPFKPDVDTNDKAINYDSMANMFSAYEVYGV